MAPITLYVNGRILTMVPGAPVAAAMAVQEGRLAAVGDAEGVLALRGRDTEVVDLGGRTVLPQGAPAVRLLDGLRCHAFGSLRAAGIAQAFASDYPCGSVAPLVGIQAAVTRRTRDGEVLDADEGIPAQAALAAYTIEAARACGLEAECGSLEAGKRADLVILDANPLEAPGEALAGIRVTGTLLAGRPVWP